MRDRHHLFVQLLVMAAQLRWAFATLSSACYLKLVLLSMFIPKDFVDVLTLQMSEFSAISNGSLLLQFNRTISGLEPLTAMRHLSHHRLISSAAAVWFASCRLPSAIKNRAVSSANLNRMEYSSMNSLLNKINNVGESTQPCGKPM